MDSVMRVVFRTHFKQALAMLSPPVSPQQQMMSFMRPPGMLPAPRAPGPAGSGLLPTGLPAGGQKATAMPGTPGHTATNVIDRLGALDASGRTVDGNNAAGIAKAASEAWLTEFLSRFHP